MRFKLKSAFFYAIHFKIVINMYIYITGRKTFQNGHRGCSFKLYLLFK